MSLMDAVTSLLSDPTHDAAVRVLRAADDGSEADRRSAVERLERHIQSEPDRRDAHVVGALVALRRTT